MISKKLISLVVPVFNEECSINLFFARVNESLKSIKNYSFELIFINDGSSDKTLHSILNAKSEYSIRVVDLSRNFGKEAAMTAGISVSKGDAVIPIDVDLQDPPELIPMLLSEWERGYEVVLAVRDDRSSDHFLKRTTSSFFYKIHNKISDIKIVENAGDFRLMDRAVINAILQIRESHRFMKGIFAWAGFRTTEVKYVREKRSAGDSKFNGWRLWTFALEGITSFSTLPLRVWTYIGAIVATFAFLYGLFISLRVIFFGIDTPGYASLLVTMTFLGGIQLIGIGVLGEYIGRTYTESKRRPLYLIRKIYEVADGSERN